MISPKQIAEDREKTRQIAYEQRELAIRDVIDRCLRAGIRTIPISRMLSYHEGRLANMCSWDLDTLVGLKDAALSRVISDYEKFDWKVSGCSRREGIAFKRQMCYLVFEPVEP